MPMIPITLPSQHACAGPLRVKCGQCGLVRASQNRKGPVQVPCSFHEGKVQFSSELSPIADVYRKQFSILYPRNRNLHIFNLTKIQIFSLNKKFSFSSLQFNHIYLSTHLRINHIYFSVHLQTLYMKQIGLFIILKSC